MTEAAAPNPTREPAGRRLTPRVRWFLWAGGALIVLAVALAAAAAYYLHRAEPILRASLISTLQKHLHARVELDSFHVSALDGFSAEGEGLRIWLPDAMPKISDDRLVASGEPDVEPWQTQPWITANKLRFHALWRMIPGKPIEISVIHIEGLRILLPPKAARPQIVLPDSTATPAPLGGLISLPKIFLRRIECKNVHLVLLHSLQDQIPNPLNTKPVPGVKASRLAPGPGTAAGKPKTPLDLDFASLVLIPDSNGGPFAFEVEMTNPKPVGIIHSTGYLGPWPATQPGQPKHFDPGELPVSGDYIFDHADLGTIRGLNGTLTSKGHFTGTLRQVEVNGESNTPDFRLELTESVAAPRSAPQHGLPLHTRFQATVDGTDGDTWLNAVDATLGNTHLTAHGKIVRTDYDPVPGVDSSPRHGHDIALQVTVDRGRIEDFLRVLSSAETPLLSGDVTLSNQFHLPPAPDPVQGAPIRDRLELNGSFHLTEARFSNAKIQDKIKELSLRGQGDPKGLHVAAPTSIRSEMEGHFQLSGGILQLPDLVYEVPGAQINMSGAYGFNGGTLNFTGEAKLEAPLSKVVGGWKGFLLKPADRFLRKNGAGTDVPIHLNGTRTDPQVGIDLDRLGKASPTQQ